MSEPARHFPSNDTSARPVATAPLRDWLAQIRTQAAAVTAPLTEADQERASRASWGPRIVEQPAEPALEEIRTPRMGVEETGQDVSELMAENMLLKAQLRLEGDRYTELQAMLAEEIRDLRYHIEAEMNRLADIRDERNLWQARAEALAQPLFQKR